MTGGNNAGIAYALENDFDYVMFLNNDTVVDASMLGKMVDSSQNNGDALVVPKIVCYYEPERLIIGLGKISTGEPVCQRAINAIP